MQNLESVLKQIDSKPRIDNFAVLAMRAKIMQNMAKNNNKLPAPQPFPMRNYLTSTYGQEPQL